MNIKCWWFGCRPNPWNSAPMDYVDCELCGEVMEYADLVGDTRHNRFKSWCHYWLFRKWIPGKCPYCGNRWKQCDDSYDHIPF